MSDSGVRMGSVWTLLRVGSSAVEKIVLVFGGEDRSSLGMIGASDGAIDSVMPLPCRG